MIKNRARERKRDVAGTSGDGLSNWEWEDLGTCLALPFGVTLVKLLPLSGLTKGSGQRCPINRIYASGAMD